MERELEPGAAQPESSAGQRPSDFRILVRCRALQLRNLIDQQLRDAPWRTLSVLLLLGAIWAALYNLLDLVLRHIRNWGLVGVVADQHLFAHFFLVLAIMLTFSNAVLMYSNLYGRHEAGHLLSMPVHARSVVSVKWIEGMFLSSWSFMLLGVPLMMAVAQNTNVSWYYYPLFLGHFLGFVAIPAFLGLLSAWVVAMWAPRRPLALAISLGMILLLLLIYWFSYVAQKNVETEEWLKVMFRQIGAIKQPLLPSTWTAKGIDAAVNQKVGDSLFYLLVVLGNAAFFSWLTVNVLSRHWAEAYSRAHQGRFHPTIRRGWMTQAVCWLLFFYLPSKLRRVMLKDIRGFARDAKQWSQMAIMFGLLVIYVLNLTRLPVDLTSPYTKGLIAFLNLTTVSLILATFTSRFVYPLLSLESQQLWLLELLPVRRTTLLAVKFLFAITMTMLSAGFVMWLAVVVLDLPPLWARINLLVCFAVCIGLSGLSIGLGARFPVTGVRNPARIASGFGGTFNLIASMAFVGVEMAGVAYISFRSFGNPLGGVGALPEALTAENENLLLGLLVGALLVAGGSLWAGARHFGRMEA